MLKTKLRLNEELAGSLAFSNSQFDIFPVVEAEPRMTQKVSTRGAFAVNRGPNPPPPPLYFCTCMIGLPTQVIGFRVGALRHQNDWPRHKEFAR